MGWISNFFGKRSLKEAVDRSKTVKVHGVLFKIKPIQPLDHLKGFKSIAQEWGTYEEQRAQSKKEVSEQSVKKLKEHYADVFLSSVIKPKIVRKPEEPYVCVDELFDNWSLAEELYQKIMELTYGKKKLQYIISRGKI